MEKPMLMGSEVEYSMSGLRSGTPLEKRSIHGLLLESMGREFGCIRDTSMSYGIYLQNGMRYYLDAGPHNELSSPECSTPKEIARYDKAGEHMLLQAKRDVERRKNLQITVTKHNIEVVDPDRCSFGNHESYVSFVPLEQAADQLVPFIVTRSAYAGSGWISEHAGGGGYETSQRSRHLVRVTGVETQFDRAIFCTRVRKIMDSSKTGWWRAHLIAKDSQRCVFSMYLTFGATGLLFCLLNQGYTLGEGLALADPVRAMREASLDLWFEKRLALRDGRKLSLLDIQQCYYEDAARLVRQAGGPDWAEEVLSHWGETLETLRRDPLALSRRLDVYLKYSILDRQLRRAGMSWTELRNAVNQLAKLRRRLPEIAVQAVLSDELDRVSSQTRDEIHRVLRELKIEDSSMANLGLAVRMKGVELNYHELGGFFDDLSERDAIENVVINREDIESGMRQPPSQGRAHARGRYIEEFKGEEGWEADWCYLLNPRSKKAVDLRDPFSSEQEMQPLDAFSL